METKYSRMSLRNNKPKGCMRLLCIIIAVIFVVLVWYYLLMITQKDVSFHSSYHFTQWPQYENKLAGKEGFAQLNCFDQKLEFSLAYLENNLNKWKQSSSEICKQMLNKFMRMYSVAFRVGEVKIPVTFKKQVLKWLNNNEDLFKEMKQQYVIHIFNEYSHEHSVFSPLRAKRPQSKSDKNPYDYVKQIEAETAANCDFCGYLEHTSEDIFGRITTNYSVSAANTFKVDKWHSLILSFKHSILNMNENEIVDLYVAALKWLEKVHGLDNDFKYPWIMWDVMPHAGASQVHPHLHVGLTPDYYVGSFEGLRRGAEKYFKEFKTNFFTDLVEIHTVLGLSVTLGKATAIAQLTSKKDTEVTVVSAEPNLDFLRLIYYIVKAFMDMGYYDLSSLCVLPVMGSSEAYGSLPAILRIATRGNVADVKSEISSFELFQFSNLNLDPYQVIQRVRKSLLLRKTSH